MSAWKEYELSGKVMMTAAVKKQLDELNSFAKTTHLTPLALESDFQLNYKRYYAPKMTLKSMIQKSGPTSIGISTASASPKIHFDCGGKIEKFHRVYDFTIYIAYNKDLTAETLNNKSGFLFFHSSMISTTNKASVQFIVNSEIISARSTICSENHNKEITGMHLNQSMLSESYLTDAVITARMTGGAKADLIKIKSLYHLVIGSIPSSNYLIKPTGDTYSVKGWNNHISTDPNNPQLSGTVDLIRLFKQYDFPLIPK